MVKLKNKKKVEWAFKRFKSGKSDQKWLSWYLGVTPRWFRVVYQRWLETGRISGSRRQLGRPRTATSPEVEALILEEYEFTRNAVYLEKVLYAKHKIRVPHNRIHMVLRKHGLAQREPNKSRRRKPWVRYERAHSLSAGHTDWYQLSDEHPHFCAVLDDSSRKILAAGEFSHATARNSIKLVQEVIDKYGHIRVICEIISDHGTQFTGNKPTKKGQTKHTFSDFLRRHGIKHILCRVKHPQSNGKMEKFFDLYRRHRYEFVSLDDFITWYNNRPHGSLNLRWAETPNMAFQRRLPQQYFFKQAVRFLKL